jgi:hypothetical protein
MGLPTSDHVIYIPGVLLLGLAVGWALGARAARQQIQARRKRAAE